MIGTILLWVLLALLGLLVLALVLPAVLYVSYAEGDFVVKARVLFVKLTVFPLKERQHKPKAAKKEKKQDSKEETKPKKKKTMEQWIRLVKRIASAATKGMRVVLRGLYIRKASLVLPVHAADAAETALRCGQVQALVGSTRAVLENRLHISYKRLVILPDFTGQLQNQLSFSCNIQASPVIMVAAAIVGFKQFLLYGRRSRKKPKRRPPQRKSTSAPPVQQASPNLK